MKRTELLDRLFTEVEAVILSRQHPVSGLLPASTSVNTHGDYTDAWVRDNVNAIICVWCLAMAYRRNGEQIKSDELEQATIKLMRALLQSMMRQAQKVEAFKHTLKPNDSLHAKYDTATGLPVVSDDAWGHLQIDATSLFLLMLAQMSASGLRIVRTFSEVDFVQNLLYYIASAYRIPDFGIWERGNKINNGKTEINASSVGMAKAALQALDGFNLFGKDGSPRAVVHTVADAISLARNTLAALLPRESLSKEVDSALLGIIGFPAFAVGDKALVLKTRDAILEKLGGNYGCKRFLWDGHQTVLEESSRIYYEHSELANFEHIESEWPLFFTYLYIHALFEGHQTTAQHYRKKLESLMVQKNGFGLLPELYYLPEENIAAEKKNPRSQPRIPNDNLPLMWAQSLYLTGLMLDEGLITRDDLDPLHMRRRARHITKTDIALVVLAENNEVKDLLTQHGVIAESLEAIRPLTVISAQDLVETYTHVGANKALGLSGRPRRRLQSLATSQTYAINNKLCLCLSWMQTEQGDYRSFDAQLMTESLQREISHIRAHWMNTEVAVFTWMVDRNFCEAPDAAALFQALRDLQLRTQHEHVGYASASLAYRASRVNKLIVPGFSVTPINVRLREMSPNDAPLDVSRLQPEIVALLDSMETAGDKDNYTQLAALLTERALSDPIGHSGYEAVVQDLVRYVYGCSQRNNRWMTARYCYALLGHNYIDVADGLSVLAARHLAVVIGKDRAHGLVVDSPRTNNEIIEEINRIIPDPLERTLVQEMLAIIGAVIRLEPRLFDGLRSVQLQNLMMLCAGATDPADLLERVGVLSPSELMCKIRQTFASQRKAFSQDVSIGFSRKSWRYDLHSSTAAENAHAVDTDWFEWRVARGLITHLDDEFLQAIWQGLACSKKLIFGDSGSTEFALDCELVRSSMTPGEESFAHLIDHLTLQLHPPYYKSAVVEALHGYILYCFEHKEARFDQPIMLSEVLESAAENFIAEQGEEPTAERALDVLMQQPPHVLQHYVLQVFAAMQAATAVLEE